jgi:WD40 repeat protein
LWDVNTGVDIAVLQGHDDLVYCVGFSPDGQSLATGSFDGDVRVWSTTTGATLTKLHGHDLPVICVIFSPDGRHIASGSQDGTVRMWDVQVGAELFVLRGHKGTVNSVVFSPDGRTIVSGGADGTARVWDTQGGVELRIISGHEGAVWGVAVSPDGRRIASGSHEPGRFGDSEQPVRVWDAQLGAELAILRGHDGPVWGTWFVRFSPDGHRIVSGSWEERVRLWDALTFECVEEHRGPGDAIAIAAGPVAFAFRLLVRGLESVIEEVSTGREIAWLPVAFEHISCHPNGLLWAGSSANYLALFQLESANAGVAAPKTECRSEA